MRRSLGEVRAAVAVAAGGLERGGSSQESVKRERGEESMESG